MNFKAILIPIVDFQTKADVLAAWEAGDDFLLVGMLGKVGSRVRFEHTPIGVHFNVEDAIDFHWVNIRLGSKLLVVKGDGSMADQAFDEARWY